MNPETQRALKMLLDSAEKLGETAWDQAPLVFNDLVKAGLIEGIVSMLGAVLLMVAARWLTMRGRALFDDDDDTEPLGFMVCVGAALAAIFGVLSLYHGAIQTLTCWLAPRAYIISELK